MNLCKDERPELHTQGKELRPGLLFMQNYYESLLSGRGIIKSLLT